MGVVFTKSEFRTRFRKRVRNSNTDFHDNTYLDDTLAEVLRDDIGNDLAKICPDYYLTFRVYTAITDALDHDAAGTADRNSLYPLPDDLGTLRWIYRDDLSQKPTLWSPRAEVQNAHRFNGVMTGTLSLGDSTYSLPRVYTGQSATPIGKAFKVLPIPGSTTEKFGVAYDRRPILVRGDEEVIDVPPEMEEAVVSIAAWKALMEDGDPQAENLGVLLHGDGRSEGTYAKAKRALERRLHSNMVLGRMRTG